LNSPRFGSNDTDMRGSNAHLCGARMKWGAAALLVAASAPTLAVAQMLQPAGVPPQQLTTPSAPNPYPGSSLVPPADIPNVPSTPAAPAVAPPVTSTPVPLPPAQPAPTGPSIPAGQVALMVSARFGRDMPQPIANGIYWRVYRAKPDSSGSFRPVKEDKSATPTFVLPPGDYVVHAVLGLVSAVKVVQLRSDPMREVFDLPAGGLRLEGKVGDVRIPAGQINFDVFQGSQFEPGDRRPIAQGVMTGDVIVVPEGTYYIVSNYGDANAVVRSDIRVQVGKLTDVTVNHRAAVITLKLVSGEGGGGALANTAWSVLSPSGDVIKESTGAFPRVILAEGDYRVIARNEGALYQRDFKVIAGVDGEVEVVAHGN
jgi:nucleoside phosphorylase